MLQPSSWPGCVKTNSVNLLHIYIFKTGFLIFICHTVCSQDKSFLFPFSDMHQHNFLILYGSETGKAESIAQLIYGLSEEHGYVTKLLCLSEVDKVGIYMWQKLKGKKSWISLQFDLSQESCVVFVSSTTGDGEQPENARKFFASLSRNNLDSNHLHGLQVNWVNFWHAISSR